ncbi:MAG TPA: elongation factor P [Chloroflexi bacterium]|jgi:elongation factor P|nr:elongation factor P [Chloroflexota bacterium]
MIPVTQLRRGVVFEDDGQLWRVLEYDHYKPGRGNAIIRTKLRNLRTNATVSRTFLSGASVQDVRLDHRTVQFLYSDGDYYHFMDVETYEQPMLEAETLSDVIPYLKEGITIDLELYQGEPLGIELPITVDLEVIDAPPGYAGDTATSATKQVTLETGLKLEVPLFIESGDVVRVDTRTGEYLTRV